MVHDLRYALRLCRRRPGFSATIIATLAVGIGLTTATYSVLYGVLLRPLPYSSPSSLVTSRSVSAGMWSAWQQRTAAVDGLAVYNMGLAPLVFTGAEPVSLRQAAVSTNFLAVLGVRPIIGRDFEPRDAERGAEPVLMLTYDAWQHAFGGRHEVVGTIARFESAGRRVIGVLPPDFMFPTRFTVLDVKVLTPLEAPLGHQYRATLVARLRQGVTLTQARAEELTIAQSRPKAEPPPTATLTALNHELLGSSQPALLMLFGAVGCLLLIGCANAGNLLLAEGVADRREVAVRFAVGATRAQVARQVLTRSCTLSVVGGGLGVLLAYWTFDLLRSLVPGQLPRAGDIHIDPPVLAFALVLSLTTGLIIAVTPLWHLSRGDLQPMLQHRDRATVSGRRIRLVVLAGETALAVVLLLGAALFARSFVRLLSADLGFTPRNVLTLRVRALPSPHQTVEQQRAFLDEALRRVRTIAGVSGAGAVELLPLTRARRGGSLVALGRSMTANPLDVEPRVVSDGYFESMGIEVVAGRSFTRHDVTGGRLVAVINETLARQLWAGENPIGRHIQPPPGSGAVASDDHREVREVVGVVQDVRLFAVDTKADAQVYIPYSQSWLVPAQLVVRTTGNPMSVVPAVRRGIYELEPRALIENTQPLTAQVASSIAQPRFQTWLLLLFGCSGLLLAAVGIAGVVAQSVSSRTREIGIRIALGASPPDVIRAVTATSLLSVAIGLAIGFASAVALSRVARAFLFEISTYDPLAYIVVGAVLMVTALLSAWLPARRAERVDPVVALRAE